MKDNKGVTLIELIIVMLIISVLAGGAMFGVQSLYTGSAKNTTEEIRAMLSAVRVENMSKGSLYYLVIEELSGSYYCSIQTIEESEWITISKKKLDLRDGEIIYINSGDSTQYLVSSIPVTGRTVSEKLEICFQKDTGGLQANSDNKIITTIGVTSSSRSYTIGLVEATGKNYIQ